MLQNFRFQRLRFTRWEKSFSPNRLTTRFDNKKTARKYMCTRCVWYIALFISKEYIGKKLIENIFCRKNKIITLTSINYSVPKTKIITIHDAWNDYSVFLWPSYHQSLNGSSWNYDNESVFLLVDPRTRLYQAFYLYGLTKLDRLIDFQTSVSRICAT